MGRSFNTLDTESNVSDKDSKIAIETVPKYDNGAAVKAYLDALNNPIICIKSTYRELMDGKDVYSEITAKMVDGSVWETVMDIKGRPYTAEELKDKELTVTSEIDNYADTVNESLSQFSSKFFLNHIKSQYQKSEKTSPIAYLENLISDTTDDPELQETYLTTLLPDETENNLFIEFMDDNKTTITPYNNPMSPQTTSTIYDTVRDAGIAGLAALGFIGAAGMAAATPDDWNYNSDPMAADILDSLLYPTNGATYTINTTTGVNVGINVVGSIDFCDEAIVSVWKGSTKLFEDNVGLVEGTQKQTTFHGDSTLEAGFYEIYVNGRQTDIFTLEKEIIPPNNDIPEFPTIVLPVLSILGLAFLFGRKKE